MCPSIFGSPFLLALITSKRMFGEPESRFANDTAHSEDRSCCPGSLLCNGPHHWIPQRLVITALITFLVIVHCPTPNNAHRCCFEKVGTWPGCLFFQDTVPTRRLRQIQIAMRVQSSQRPLSIRDGLAFRISPYPLLTCEPGSMLLRWLSIHGLWSSFFLDCMPCSATDFILAYSDVRKLLFLVSRFQMVLGRARAF